MGSCHECVPAYSYCCERDIFKKFSLALQSILINFKFVAMLLMSFPNENREIFIADLMVDPLQKAEQHFIQRRNIKWITI